MPELAGRVADGFADGVREHEERWLSPLAGRSYETRGRAHAGEQALDEIQREHGGEGFRHNRHSLRVVEELEREGRGLNLTWEVRDGILNHTGPDEPATLEGKIVRIVDRVAYINHDIDDALRAGILDKADLPAAEIAVLGDTGSRRIDTLVHDLVESSADVGDIVQSEEIGAAMLALRSFM